MQSLRIRNVTPVQREKNNTSSRRQCPAQRETLLKSGPLLRKRRRSQNRTPLEPPKNFAHLDRNQAHRDPRSPSTKSRSPLGAAISMMQSVSFLSLVYASLPPIGRHSSLQDSFRLQERRPQFEVRAFCWWPVLYTVAPIKTILGEQLANNRHCTNYSDGCSTCGGEGFTALLTNRWVALWKASSIPRGEVRKHRLPFRFLNTPFRCLRSEPEI